MQKRQWLVCNVAFEFCLYTLHKIEIVCLTIKYPYLASCTKKDDTGYSYLGYPFLIIFFLSPTQVCNILFEGMMITTKAVLVHMS